MVYRHLAMVTLDVYPVFKTSSSSLSQKNVFKYCALSFNNVLYSLN